MERISRRLVALIGGMMTGICLGLCAFFSNTLLVGVCLALTGVGIACVYMPLMLGINDFLPEKFVLLNTISLYGHTVGTMLLPFIVERSLEAYGYYGTFLILDGITLHIIVCAVAIRNPILKNPAKGHPQDQMDALNSSDVRCTCFKEEDRDDQPLDNKNDTGTIEALPIPQNGIQSDTWRKEFGEQKESARRDESSWKSLFFTEPLLLFNLLTVFLFGYILYSWMFFLVPHAEQLGIPQSQAVFLSSIAGLGGIIGRTVFVALVAKDINALYIDIVAGIINTLSFLLDFIGSDYTVRAALAIIQGFSLCAEDSVFFIIPKETLNNEDNFSLALALVSFSFGLGATAAGYVSGYLFDITKSYTKVFIIIGIVHAVTVISMIITTSYLRKRKTKSRTITNDIGLYEVSSLQRNDEECFPAGD